MTIFFSPFAALIILGGGSSTVCDYVIGSTALGKSDAICGGYGTGFDVGHDFILRVWAVASSGSSFVALTF